MRNPRLASVYAKSLIEVAQTQNQLDTVQADMQYVKGVCNASKEFKQLLGSPIISITKKSSILAAVLQNNVSPLSWAFITLVVKKQREGYLDQIADAFLTQYNEVKGIHEVTLTTAVAVDDAVKTEIIDFLKKETKFSNVKIQSKVNPDLIGGFVLEFNNNLIDASISNKLKQLKKQLTNAPVA